MPPSRKVRTQGLLGRQARQLRFEVHMGKIVVAIEWIENHLDAYESSKIYKERMKRWHDKFLTRREFWEGDLVLLFNSRLKLFPGKLLYRWSGPFKELNIYRYRAIEIWTEVMGSFKLNGSKLKHYIAREPLEGKVSSGLPSSPTT